MRLPGRRSSDCTNATSIYEHLSYRKLPQIAVVAVARELVGFLWAVMPDVPTPATTAV